MCRTQGGSGQKGGPCSQPCHLLMTHTAAEMCVKCGSVFQKACAGRGGIGGAAGQAQDTPPPPLHLPLAEWLVPICQGCCWLGQGRWARTGFSSCGSHERERERSGETQHPRRKVFRLAGHPAKGRMLLLSLCQPDSHSTTKGPAYCSSFNSPLSHPLQLLLTHTFPSLNPDTRYALKSK